MFNKHPVIIDLVSHMYTSSFLIIFSLFTNLQKVCKRSANSPEKLSKTQRLDYRKVSRLYISDLWKVWIKFSKNSDNMFKKPLLLHSSAKGLQTLLRKAQRMVLSIRIKKSKIFSIFFCKHEEKKNIFENMTRWITW